MAIFGFRRERAIPTRGILRALRRNTAGNVIAIVAASIFPLIGMIGGAVDISRMYLSKTRLQQACDAGALAGRKVMGGGTWNANSNAANTAAVQFFNANFLTGAYGTGTLTKAFTESNGKVTGIASVVVPMTLMQVFDMPTRTLRVNCEADMRLPNTDVMFVLDTTGSMNDPASPGDPRKIDTLHFAVKCFYETLARLDTDADCNPGFPGPTGGVGGDIQIRFGFMPYATNVNVGRLLPTSYFANSWSYQSRVPTGTYEWTTPANDSTAAVNASGGCDVPAGSSTVRYAATKLTRSGAPYCQITKQTYGPVWRYSQNASLNISGLKNGSGWNAGVTLPGIGDGGTGQTASWDGCIEERHTVRETNYYPRPADANDLDFDTPPTPGDPNSLWGPALPGAVFFRDDAARNPVYPDVVTADSFLNPSSDLSNPHKYYCPREARKLQTWDSSTFDAYVDSLTPGGNTYHDIGILWGARFISPNGIFASENRATPRGGKIQRNVIFMTDGDTNAPPEDYNAYGIPFFDRRQTPVGSAPTATQTNAQVNARFTALCTAINNHGAGADKIVLWVIAFGDGSNATTVARLKSCATDDAHFYPARTAADLKGAFQSIANQISQLRLTQ